jgi:hypothetical protein
MFTPEQHIDNLVRHIRLVQDATVLLGKRLIQEGRVEFGRKVVASGFTHDASKWSGLEWKYLHSGDDVDHEKLEQAILQHTETNEHHPEHWGGIDSMSELAISEMVCDWYARSQEFGTGLRDWIEETAVPRYKIASDSLAKKRIDAFVDMLLINSFVAAPKKKKKG